MKLSVRIFALMAIAQIVLLVGASFLVLKQTRAALRENFAQDSEKIVCSIGLGIAAIDDENKVEIKKRLDYFSKQFGLSFAFVRDTANPVKVISGDLTLEAEVEKLGMSYNPAEHNMYVTYCEGASNANLEVGIARSYGNIVKAETNISNATGGVFLIEITILLLLAGWVAYFIHKRTNPILEACEGYSRGDFKSRIPITGQDEINAIAESINRMVDDLVNLRRLDQEHAQTQASQSKLAALGEMAGGVAHEINNPLAIISAKLSLMARKVQSASPELAAKLDADIKKTLEVVGRIAKIVRALRSISRDGSTDPFEVTPVKAILEDAYSLSLEKLKSNSIEFRLDCSDDIYVSARATELSQVALNLITNSFHAVKNESEKWVGVKVIKSGDDVEIYFSDSGPGIPTEIQEKIMQPFFTTKPVGEGTGLGLSISQGIAKAHNGSLTLFKGQSPTTFLLKLPLVKAGEKKTAA